ncbi:hypothetical protein V6N12_007700 [Hibiscus sabdariffa]|uniref:Uncharacterized protein n=1 Tax=Hibiscus sabdariffa TaxID=183260 RepID=A0ABR2F2J3_9ROSI
MVWAKPAGGLEDSGAVHLPVEPGHDRFGPGSCIGSAHITHDPCGLHRPSDRRGSEELIWLGKMVEFKGGNGGLDDVGVRLKVSVMVKGGEDSVMEIMEMVVSRLRESSRCRS